MYNNRGVVDFSRFWKYVFPADENMENFLTCFGEHPLEYREFIFGEFFRRNDNNKNPLRFKTMKQLHDYLIDNGFSCFQAGPVFYSNISREDKYVLFPRPLFFDVDLDDYHAEFSKNRPLSIARIIRSCDCLAGKCCDTCWKEIAVQPLKEMLNFLKNIMEYKRIIPMYSGNRGFWIIVWDKEVWLYDTIARTNIANRIGTCIDRTVTIQATHAMKVPLTPHAKTGTITIPISDPDVFVPSHAPHYMDTDKEILREWALLLFKK